jgi:DNA-binding response OmpR family regulator
MYKVLLIDDEPDIVDFTSAFLCKAGFEAKGISDATVAISTIESFNPDVVLLDKMMPKVSGHEIVQQMRQRRDLADIPVIMITGQGTEKDKIDSFDSGVDQFMTKPFSLPELSARVSALCRRKENRKLVHDGLAIDVLAHKVTIDGADIPLTLTEFKLLHELFINCGKVQSRDHLRQTALHNQFVTDRTIDVHIAAIRRKILAFGDRVKTVRGIGYKLDLPLTKGS